MVKTGGVEHVGSISAKQWSGENSALALSCWKVETNLEKGLCLHALFVVLFSSIPWELLVEVWHRVTETYRLTKAYH